MRSNFLRVFNFLQIKEGGPNFWGKPILQNIWIIWSAPSVFQFKKFYGPKFFLIHWISMRSAWLRSTFLRLLKFPQIKAGRPNFSGEPILQNVWIICSPLLYFNFKSFLDPNSFSFIIFQCIALDWRVIFSGSSKFYKLKNGDLVSGGNQLWKKSELFGHPVCVSILKVLWTQIFRHSLYFNTFCLIQEYFSQSFRISTN